MPQSLPILTAKFSIRDHVTFHETHPGMIAMRIATDTCEATIYVQGAHMTQWTPHKLSPVLYMSPKAVFAPGKAIRGGIPVIFPWFGDRWNAFEFDHEHGTRSGAHGFARTALWTVDRVHLTPDGEVIAVFSLPPSDVSTSFGYPSFHVTLEFRIGRELNMLLTVINTSAGPMQFEEALHTYFAVDDVHPARLEGLRGSTYIDKRDKGLRKVQRETLFAFTRDVDQTHVRTAEPLTLHDPAGHRSIHIEKKGSNTSVIWNPWTVLSPGLPDLAPDGWQHFICVETVNATDDRITLAPGASHGMATTIHVLLDDKPTGNTPS
jgi:glucose-6-phosphate 1-epimerase